MRRIVYVLAGAAALVLLVIAYFDATRMLRETQTASQAAPRGGSFVHVRDADVFVQQAGDPHASAVVLIHGTGTWSEIWRETMDALAPRYRVVAIDLPPFGYSSKLHGAASYTAEMQGARIIGVLDALHIPRATLVGHSVGARPVAAAALAAPARIERLVLVDPALGLDSTPPPALMTRFFATPPVRNAVLSSYGTNPLFLRRLFLSFVSRKDSVTDARLRVIAQPMAVAGTTDAYGDWLQCLMSSPAANLPRLATLHMPVHLLWGRTDTVTPLAQGELLHKTIPGSTLTVLEDVGHIPYIEDSRRFNEALIAALR